MASSFELYLRHKEKAIQELHLVIDDIIQRHVDLGQKASGDFIKSLEIQQTATGVNLLGIDYTKYLVNGRQPGKMPPKANIVKWLQDKFGYNRELAEKIAYPIQKKISEEGTDIYKDGGTDLIDSVLNDERINKILEDLRVIMVDWLKMEINEMMSLR